MAQENVGRGDVCAVDARALGEDHGLSVELVAFLVLYYLLTFTQ